MEENNHREEFFNMNFLSVVFHLCGEIAYIQNRMMGSYTAPGQELYDNAQKLD